MDCQHGHHHHHHHHHHDGLAEGLSSDNLHRLKNVLFLSAGYMLLQFIGGYGSGSLALVAEAGHKLSDTVAIGLALFAAWLATRPATAEKTFGFGRAEVLVAFGNGMVLIVIASEILREAYERWGGHHHHEINSPLMMGVAAIGLILNLASLGILGPAKNKNLNIKGAYLHVMTDLIGSCGTFVSAGIIWLTHWVWLDLVLSGVIALLVFSNALRILAEALHVLLEGAPKRLDITQIENFLRNIPNVLDIHDLHVWTITTGKDALLVHAKVPTEAFQYGTAASIENQLRDKYGFCHITVQLEPEGFEEQVIPF